MSAPIVIVGSGFAAYQLVKNLRRQDSSVEITVLTADDGHDYNKPDLSHVFSKQQTVEDVIVMSAADFAQQHNITLHSNTAVTSIDVANQRVNAGEQTFAYSQLILATGASPFIPPMEGGGLSNIITINSLREFERVTHRVTQAKSLLVIGGGLIGVEIALDLANAGKKVTIVEPNAQLMSNLLPDYIAIKLELALKNQDVSILTEHVVANIDTSSEQGDSKASVKLKACGGNRQESLLNVDEVLVCAGLNPNTQLASTAGLKVNRGICVDEKMQTSQTRVYALGDCAEFQGQVRAYLQPTLISAMALANTLLGNEKAVTLPNMMIKVKTPSFPIQIGGNTQNIDRWTFDVKPEGMIAKALDCNEKMVGFVATQALTTQAFQLLREL